MPQVENFSDKIKQFGYANAGTLMIKKVLEKLGIFKHTYLVYKKKCNAATISSITLPEGYHLKKLALSDFSAATHFLFRDSKLELFKKQLENPAYHSYGIFKGDELAAYIWISYSNIELPNPFNEGFYLPLEPNEGYQFDSFCHPTHRRKGLNAYLVHYGEKELINNKKDYAVSIIRRENKASRGSWEKVGFKEDRKVMCTLWWGKKKICIANFNTV
ncbi:GNAT family N-acetyltransferase [Flavihumibacter rivuli]|uniref:GNAT family N-acetyltransferase n=1 Tax=Flavihumibacter rivuli TaxID=2838156 RepID=UPI001BDF483F|nr:GNAT family N-acetyltransferase [Flavihumibacter rivuli]ULQ55727.1 GNAT family N-acetyltransferase [Flavihumibacter rivuli]